MKAEHGTAAIVWVVILFVLLAALVVLAVDRRALVAKLETAQDTTAKRAKLQQLSRRLETFSKELQAKKQDYQKLSARVTELQSNLRSLVQALKQAEAEREMREKRAADAEKKAGQFEKQAQTLGNQVPRLTRNKQELQKDVAHFKKLVETAARAGCTWPQVIVDRVVMNGTVQSVNTKDRSVVLSLGRDDKVVRGLLFYISRDGAYVGRVRVNHVEPKTCSARIVQIEDNMTIRPGDQASTKPFVR
jgi:hypothetical protein